MNISPFSTKKIVIKRKAYSKANISKNLHLMNLPEFHLNRTIKAYINEKLSKANCSLNNQNLTENIIPVLKIQSKCKQRNHNNNLTRINTMNIIKPKKIFINKHSYKSKESFSPKSIKKIYKSKSKSKFNISKYVLILKKNNKNQRINNKFKKKYLNDSEQKYHKYSGLISINNNPYNKLIDKTSSISHQENQILSNCSSLEFNNRKKPCGYGHTTSKKSKFNKQILGKEKKINIKFSKLNKLRNKSNEIKNIIINKKSINNKININLDNSFIRKSFNIINSGKNDNINLNYINNTENNIIYNKTESNHIYFHDCNISDKTISKIDNISTTNNKTIDINMNITDNKIKDDNTINNLNIKNDNSFIYIQKIEKLENENKLLKNEINDSNYKLKLLEEKINKLLLLGKSSIPTDKEECPKPTPYVKKYSADILQNNK